MTYFFLPDLVEVCRKHGIEPEVAYNADGITTWGVDVPPEHPLLKDPDFLGGMLQSVMSFASMILTRLKPPVFMPHVSAAVACTTVKGDAMALIAAHRRDILEYMLTDPATKKCPKLVRINTFRKLAILFQEALKENVTALLYFVSPKISETIPLKDATALINLHLAAEKEFPHGRPKQLN